MELKKPFAVLDRAAAGSEEEGSAAYKVGQRGGGSGRPQAESWRCPATCSAACAACADIQPALPLPLHCPASCRGRLTAASCALRPPPAPPRCCLQVIGVVREKILFKARPRPLITKPAGQK